MPSFIIVGNEWQILGRRIFTLPYVGSSNYEAQVIVRWWLEDWVPFKLAHIYIHLVLFLSLILVHIITKIIASCMICKFLIVYYFVISVTLSILRFLEKSVMFMSLLLYYLLIESFCLIFEKNILSDVLKDLIVKHKIILKQFFLLWFAIYANLMQSNEDLVASFLKCVQT